MGAPTQASVLPLPELVPEQEHLTGYIPTVVGPVEFREWKKQLERIHGILGLGGVEETFQRLSLARRNEDERRQAASENRPFRELSTGEQAGYPRLSSQVLRCNVARTLTGESFRDFGCRLSESMLVQWFCRLDRSDTLLGAASEGDASGGQTLELTEALNLEAYFLDATCVKRHIHFPVDWVLLRDAARTLMQATMLIRKRGLKVRMEEPAEFLKRMNQLCMKRTHARRKKDGKRARKAVPREMKKLSKIIAAHAARHRELLGQGWRETDLKPGEARQIIEWMDTILERLPHAIRQAHERTIGERQLLNEEKIPSLYEGHAAVYVRGKAGAEVEFGSQLLLGESESGVIVDWEWVCGNPQAAGGPSLRQVSGDRGFDSKANRGLLENGGIYNAICPQAPGELKKRMKDAEFVELQQRRSQTEARISIFKNGFLGSPVLSQGQGNQKREVAWSVLAHNLWVIARLPQGQARALAKAR